MTDPSRGSSRSPETMGLLASCCRAQDHAPGALPPPANQLASSDDFANLYSSLSTLTAPANERVTPPPPANAGSPRTFSFRSHHSRGSAVGQAEPTGGVKVGPNVITSLIYLIWTDSCIDVTQKPSTSRRFFPFVARPKVPQHVQAPSVAASSAAEPFSGIEVTVLDLTAPSGKFHV